MIKQTVEHWHYVSPLLSKPDNQEDFNTLVEALDDLPEVATQSVISEILNGKRQLNIRHIKALTEDLMFQQIRFFNWNLIHSN